MTVDITLKRHAKLWRLIVSAVIGALSLIVLFLPFNKLILFIFKIIISILMCLIAYGYHNFKFMITNIIYLYMCSVILGGFLYYLDTEFSYKRDGLIFYFDGLSINYLLLIILAPLILGLYIFEYKKFKSTLNYSYSLEIVFLDGQTLNCTGFLDTGNKLKDPISQKYVLLLSKKILTPYINNRSPIYVPFKSLHHKGLISCYKISYIKINNRILKNYLVGISDDNFNINGTDVLLNYKLLEDIC